MSSIITGILKATFGLLVNKGRDVAAEKLKDGDFTDQQFRKVVVRELDDIKSKIDGLARKDLLASISFFKEGLVFLYQLLDQPKRPDVTTATSREETEEEKQAVSLLSASGGSKLSSIKTSSLVEELKDLNLNDLNKTAKQMLADAKKRFEDARRKATEAFSTESLNVSDRVLAMKIRIMATLMEKVDSPSNALASCGLCLEELHSIPLIQNCFEVELTKPHIKYQLNKNERRELIAEVCHMNFVVYSVTRMVDSLDAFKLPVLDTGTLKIDPLRNCGLFKALKEFRLERCCLRWMFGQEGEVKHRLDGPWSITTNTQGQFIVADTVNIKVFDSSGKFLRSLSPLTEDEQKHMTFNHWRMATDGNDNLYVIASSGLFIYVFDQQYNLYHKFPLRQGVKRNYVYDIHSLTVSNDGKVFLLLQVELNDVRQVDVYENDGRYVYSFGQEILSYIVLSYIVSDITIANASDRVMILDDKARCVHVFSTQGEHLHQFAVQGDTCRTGGAIAFHHPSEHIIVSSCNPDNENRGQVSIYTKDGEFVRNVQLHTDEAPNLTGLTVTVDGRVAVTNYLEDKVHIISI